MERARLCVQGGATFVAAIEPGMRCGYPSERVGVFRGYLADFLRNDERIPEYAGRIDVVLLGWPTNSPIAGIARAVQDREVLYIGKNTNVTACGDPRLWSLLVQRKVLAYLPDSRNTLIHYSTEPRGPLLLHREECAALDHEGPCHAYDPSVLVQPWVMPGR